MAWLTIADIEPGKRRLHGIVSRLCGLIETVSNRVSEEPLFYPSEQEKEQEYEERRL